MSIIFRHRSSHRSLYLAWGLILLIATSQGCQRAPGDAARGLRGGVDVTGERVTGTPPRHSARMVYVSDFALDASNFRGDQGVRGMLPERAQQGVLGQIGERLPHRFATDDPVAKARQIVDTLAAALVTGLWTQGVRAERLAATTGALPVDGWLLQGLFTEVDEGNRFKRAIIGFGQGASTMEVQVGISDLASKQPRAPFMVFGTVEDPSKLPGAVVTMNPYVAAAKFVIEKNASQRDIQKTADQIVGELLRYEQQIKQAAQTRRVR